VGRDETRAELIETIEERFRKIEELSSGNDQPEAGVGGAVGPSNGAAEAGAGEREREGEPGHRP
jgi:hypothetical protein